MEQPTPLDPAEAERLFAEMLEEAELPCFSSTFYDPEIDQLQFTWKRGLTIFMDLSGGDIEPLDDWDRASILGLPLPCCDEHEPFHLFVAGSGDDPRTTRSVPGVEARARELGLRDPDAMRAARARVEWRPSLEMLDEVIDEFCG